MPVSQLKGVRQSPWYKRPEYLLILFIGIVYVVLIGRYRAFDLDDVWFLSFSHTFWIEHLQTDTFMLQVFPGGMGGVVAFGKLAAIVQAAILSVLGWSLTSATAISIGFVVAALILLADMCRQLGYTSKFTTCFIALVGLTEPFVFVAEKTRYEFLPLFLLALALWLASRRFLMLAMFAAALATEVEPAAAVIPCAIFVAILVQNNRNRVSLSRILPRLALGVAMALAIYFLLHPHIVSIFEHAQWATVSGGTFPGGFVTAYFVHYKRHLPELLLLIVAFAVSLSRPRRAVLLDWPALCSLTVLLCSAMLRWGNVPYFCFISPFLFLFILQALYTERFWKLIVAAVLLCMLPQYAYRFYYWTFRHAGFSQQDENQVAAAIDGVAAVLGTSPSKVNIVGNYDVWYAHPSNFVNLDRRIVTPALLERADLLLCFDKPVDPVLSTGSNYEMPCATLNGIPSRIAETLTLRGHTLEVLIPNHH